MLEFDKDLFNWAEKVIEEVTPIAKELNKDYYPLQSTIKKRPEILFLGINPGGARTYDSQSLNDNWDFEESLDANDNVIYKMKPERLLLGNPYFNKHSDNWKIIKGLRRISLFDKALETDDFLLANYYYLSTANFKAAQTKGQKKALEICKSLTYELIKIVKPKLIIVLGTATGIDLLKSFEKQSNILMGHHMRLLISAEFKGIKCFAIPHPSTMAITKNEADAISKNLTELINNEDLSNFDFEKINWTHLSIDNIENLLQNQNINLKFKKRNQKNEIYDSILDKGVDKLLVSLNFKDKYLGIRDFNANTSGPVNRFYANLKNAKTYIEAISEKKVTRTNSWLIQKFFTGYKFNDIDSLSQKIVKDLINLYSV